MEPTPFLDTPNRKTREEEKVVDEYRQGYHGGKREKGGEGRLDE